MNAWCCVKHRSNWRNAATVPERNQHCFIAASCLLIYAQNLCIKACLKEPHVLRCAQFYEYMWFTASGYEMGFWYGFRSPLSLASTDSECILSVSLAANWLEDNTHTIKNHSQSIQSSRDVSLKRSMCLQGHCFILLYD